MSVNYIYLNKFFSKKNLTEKFSRDRFSAEIFNKEIQNYYDILRKEYRNEFFFKNTLFNKLVLGKYSLNTTTAFSEVVVGNSKADFVLINKTFGIVYEIKTDLDNLERMDNQLNDYSKAFSEIYIVTSEKYYYPVFKTIKEKNPNVGIIVLTKKETLSVRKKATLDSSKLNHEVLFKLLRKNEYEQILYFKFKCLPNAKPVQYFRTSLQWFKTIEIREAQKLVFKQLKKRVNPKELEKIKYFPIPIRWIIYSSNLNSIELEKIYKKITV